MLVKFLQKNKFFRKIIYKLGRNRAEKIIREISQYLNNNDSIIDIGAGTCNICEILMEKQFQATPLDVKNLSFIEEIKPVIYNNKIPFQNDSFNVSLLLTVLHHTPDPEEILKEAKRVSERIIIIEDIYTGLIHKYLTYFVDSLLNFEFIGHPHTNKSDKEWKLFFKEIGLNLKAVKYRRSLLVFKQAIYYLE